MYNVTQTYLNAIKAPAQEHDLFGELGNDYFSKDNIVSGTFHIQNQCTATDDVVLGSVYTGTLTATFHGITHIGRYDWVGQQIKPIFAIKNAHNVWEQVPLGIFTIKEAKHNAEGVEVTAYDDMIKLDRKFEAENFRTAKKMYGYITDVCGICGIHFGMTEAQVQALPNGNTLIGIVGTESNSELKEYANDIDTYRDLVFWIAQTMACFATINRDGELVFRKYKNGENTDDEITEDYRLAGAEFDDFVTNYTGIYVTNTKSGNDIYYGYDVAALQQEITETENKIAGYEEDLDEAAEKYAHGEITEAEYRQIVKTLEKKTKQAETRLQWLEDALVKAQDGEDGLFMDLGENPFLQPDGIGTQYPEMRRRILNALDVISYTPFSCSTVFGVHYDLGDIIQFTGGHATPIGETCCLMAYDYTFNGEYVMQGFGSDPSKPVIKEKTAKSANKANKNTASINTKLEKSPQVTVNDNGTISIATSKEKEQSGAYIRTFKMIMYHPYPEHVIPAPYYQIWEVTVHSTSGVVLCFAPHYDSGGNRRTFTLNRKTYYDTIVNIVTTDEHSYVTQKWVGGIPMSSGLIFCPYGVSYEWDQPHYLSRFTGYGTVTDSPYYEIANGAGSLIYDTYSGTSSTDRSFVSQSGNYQGTYYYAMVNENVDVPGTSGTDVKTFPTATDGYDLANSAESLAKATQGQTYERETPGFTGEINVMPTESIQTVTKSLDVVRENLPEANPTGTPTATATTLKLNGTIYDLAGGSEAIEKTQAQYDALPESEKLDPKKVYYITDGGGGGGGGASALSELTDVELTDLADGEILKYDATEEKWVNAEDGGGGGSYGGAMSVKRANWIATSSSASGTRLTDILTLDAGQYLLVGHIPYAGGTDLFDFVLYVNGSIDNNSRTVLRKTYDQFVYSITLTEQSTVYLASGTRTSVSWNSQYIDFGGLDAILLTQLSPIIYSTEEREIGVWTDGKPLYQKTFETNYTSNGTYTIDISSLSIDKVCNSFGEYNRSNGEWTEFNHYAASTYFGEIRVSSSQVRMMLNLPESNPNGKQSFTIQYTKTTDIAGSGSYAELGIPAVHYDDTERVIGTWFGETLYRRTITGLSLALNGANWVNYTAVSNIKKLIHLDAYYEGTDGRLLHCSIAEFQSLANGGLQLCATSSTFNRTINVMTLEYTKTS